MTDMPLFEERHPFQPKSGARLRFEKYDSAHPEVWQLFCEFTMAAVRAGRQKIGARLIIERIRWHYVVNQDGTEDFKINDHYCPFYVRKFQKFSPEHRDIFEVRASIADTN